MDVVVVVVVVVGSINEKLEKNIDIFKIKSDTLRETSFYLVFGF